MACLAHVSRESSEGLTTELGQLSATESFVSASGDPSSGGTSNRMFSGLDRMACLGTSVCLFVNSICNR